MKQKLPIPKQPVQMPQQPDYRQHPDYPKMMGDAVAALKVDEAMIHPQMKQLFARSIVGIPFGQLNITIDTLKDYLTTEPNTWGIGQLHKACDILLNSEVCSQRDCVDNEASPLELIISFHTLYTECTRLLQDAHKKTVQTLSTREKLKG